MIAPMPDQVVAEAPQQAQDPDKLPPWLKKIVESPLHTDTIRALLPVEPRVRYLGPKPGVAHGHVSSEEPDLATFRGDDPGEEGRRLYLHEIGHVLHLTGPRRRPAFGRTILDITRTQDPRATMPAQQFEQEAPEWVADAFAAGVATLNKVMGADRETAAAAVEQVEKDTPGTKAMVDWLLKQSIYSEHPLAVRDLWGPLRK